MFVSKRAIDRRSVIRGAGIALSLPLLDAMIPALTAQAATPLNPTRLRRIGYVYVPMGYYAKHWTPEGRRLDHLPSSLAPLQAVANHISVFSGFDLKNAYPGSHATSNSAFLSAAKAKLTESSDYYLGTTVDQIAAKQIGTQTQLPSLEMSMDLLSLAGQCDNGYACVYQNNLSWSSPTTPLPSEAHPRLVFESLFGDGGSSAQRLEQLRQKASLLDGVSEEFQQLKNRVGPADRQRIDQYLESVRDVERRIQIAERSVSDNPLPDLDRPRGVPAVYGDHARLMFDLQILAFQGDITRVTTFQLARETSNRNYPEIGVPDPHHPTTHHGGNQEKLEKVAKINQHHVGLFAEFLTKLAAIREGEGSLLDHSIFLYGSGMGDPDRHDHSDLPILVAGGAAGKHVGGKHVKFAQPVPLSNLHLTLLNSIGVPLETFSDSTGRVDQLFDPVEL